MTALQKCCAYWLDEIKMFIVPFEMFMQLSVSVLVAAGDAGRRELGTAGENSCSEDSSAMSPQSLSLRKHYAPASTMPRPLLHQIDLLPG